MALFAEGFIRYPDELPCPQVDTDLKPRERRYISDIGEVKRLRRFQSTFQAERQRISFIFTREQAEEFQKWYKEDIIEGGAWFYADWPILHKEKSVAYRFITRPVWEFLARGVYHVTASVETYERKVGKAANVYTSKIYPLYFSDGVLTTHTPILGGSIPPKLYPSDDITDSTIIVEAVMSGYIYSDYRFIDDITAAPVIITEATMKTWIYSNYSMSDDIAASHTTILSGEITFKLINYDKFDDDMTSSHTTIVAGEIA